MKNLFGNALVSQVRLGMPLNLTGNEEILVGKQGDADVVLMRVDSNILLFTKSYANGVYRYVPRGRNYWDWSGWQKNANATTDNYNMITVSNSDYSGLANPLPSSYTPTGWSRSTFADPSGAGDVMYFFKASSSIGSSLMSGLTGSGGTGDQTQWYSTTGGKVGIGAGILAFFGVLWYAFKK